MRTWLHSALTAIVLFIAAVLFLEWRSERQDRARLQAALSLAEQSLQRATASQEQRDKHLTDTVAKLESLKSIVKTQQQILARLPDVLPLPKPIVVPPDAGDHLAPILPDAPTPNQTILPP